MRGFTVACACLVILPLVLAYPWNDGILPYKREDNSGSSDNEFEYELTLPKRGHEGAHDPKAWAPKRDHVLMNDIEDESKKSIDDDLEDDLGNVALEQGLKEQGEGYDQEALNSDGDDLGVLNMQRRNGWCGNWGDFCRPDAKMKYAQCCPGMRCMCGHFWTQGKCQCKSKGTFGR